MSKVKEELKNDPLMPLRHSAEHVLHMAMQMLYPELKKVMGPPIEDGFYFDFDLETHITPEDFPKIEKLMQEIINADLPIGHKTVTLDEAKKLFKDNPYKLDTLKEIASRKEKASIYTFGEEGTKFYDVDLCAGPHVKSTGEVKAFKLLNVAGAYYKGSEKNKMLQRIYGTAFSSKEALDDYLFLQEEAKKRDHRRIGQDLNLFVFSDLVGKGLPTFGPKGATIKRELERFTVDEELKRGYLHIVSPDLAKVDLYKMSGHYPYYKDTMYPVMKVDEEELILRPMTCPHHFMFFKSEQHSYRDLPYRIAEVAHQYRYEKSGELSGLTRVRMFCLADAHIISAKDQAKQVITEVLELIDSINATLGLVKGQDYRYRLSLGDRQDTKKYYKDDASWDYAENVLREVLVDQKAPYFEAANEAAFYGPKIDIQVKNAAGKEETAFTVQYDFVMPDRFDLTFINKEGKQERPVVIHRSSIGCLERTMAFLIEKYMGNFPVWLSPVQAKVITITDAQSDYAQSIVMQLKARGIRAEIDDRNEKMQAKIRDAQLQKIPYMLIVGDREMASNQASVRLRSGEDLKAWPVDEIVRKIDEIRLTKSLSLW
jgi:threonyl-tRNA synthetase